MTGQHDVRWVAWAAALAVCAVWAALLCLAGGAVEPVDPGPVVLPVNATEAGMRHGLMWPSSREWACPNTAPSGQRCGVCPEFEADPGPFVDRIADSLTRPPPVLVGRDVPVADPDRDTIVAVVTRWCAGGEP